MASEDIVLDENTDVNDVSSPFPPSSEAKNTANMKTMSELKNFIDQFMIEVRTFVLCHYIRDHTLCCLSVRSTTHFGILCYSFPTYMPPPT